MSNFDDAMNYGNAAFGVDCGAPFVVTLHGVPGTYDAVSIDNLEIADSVGPGGRTGEHTVALWVKDTVFTAAGLTDGVLLTVRGKRLRVTGVQKEGDDTYMVTCGPNGFKI